MKTLVTQGLFAFSSSPAGTPFPLFPADFARNLPETVISAPAR